MTRPRLPSCSLWRHALPHQRWTCAAFLSTTRCCSSSHSTDVLIVGSGAAGLSAALRCHQHGLQPLIVEKSEQLGGTSAWSGGGLWVPNNTQYKDRGVKDSEEAALKYLDALIGDVGPASSPQRRLAYVRNASKVVNALSEMGCKWVPTVGMPDYHSNLPGSLKDGRSIEPAIFNAEELGEWRKHLNPPSIFAGPAMHIYEGIQATDITSWTGVRTMLKIVCRWIGSRMIGRDPVGMGQALTGQLLKANIDRKTDIWHSTALKNLIQNTEDAVTGVIVLKDGEEVTISAQAIILAAGGFAKNDEMRRKYHQQPTDTKWSSVTKHDTGEVLQAGIDIGGATALMDDAWWNPTFLNPVNNAPFISFGERGRPGAIIADANGQRFMNEAESYNDIGRHMYEHNKKTPAIPAWMIFDSSLLKKFPLMMLGPRFSEKDGLRSKFLHKSSSLEDLAQQINIDTAGLAKTVVRFNKFAHDGRDLDFHRGETAIEQMGSARLARACLGPLEKPPYYAVRIYPGDIGTKGGLLTDEHARVLKDSGEPIPGLYAAGNTSASVMGRRYAGAGATLGPAVVFAALAVDHAAGKPWK